MAVLDYYDSLAKAFSNTLFEIADLQVTITTPISQPSELVSNGIVVIIGLTGAYTGHFIFEFPIDTGEQLFFILNEKEELSQDLLFDTLAGLATMLCCEVITYINNRNKDFNLILTPPSVFSGTPLKLIRPKLPAEIITVTTPLGQITVSIALEEGPP